MRTATERASRTPGRRLWRIGLALAVGIGLLGWAPRLQPRREPVTSSVAARGTATDGEPARGAPGADLEVLAHGASPPPDLAPGVQEAARQAEDLERLRWAARQADQVDQTVEESDGGLGDERLARLAHDVRYTGADETLLRAIHELGLQRDERVVDALVDASWRPEAQARSDAVVALWRLAADGAEGPLGAEVADALERASRDADPGVAARARSALEDLEALRAPPAAPAEPDASAPACPPEVCAS